MMDAPHGGSSKSFGIDGPYHAFATLQEGAGTPLKAVSDVIGHAASQLAATTNLHGNPSEATDRMERFEARPCRRSVGKQDLGSRTPSSTARDEGPP